ncbi:MAG TPA: hypothetical protein VMZ04_07760 [Anaerolineae bacterium]|nr:hypothetical protein [Anaerolineae bacterium]
MGSLALLLMSCVFLLHPLVHAQEGVSQKMTIQAGYGTVTMGGVQWQRFSFRPDIPVGNLGIGLDLELFIDNEGKISKEGWDFSNKNQIWDTLLRKIYYIRYGKPLDRFYVRAGALDNVSLGYGLIMDDYCNTLNYPADKKLGIDLSLSDIGTFGIDVHAMVNSVGDFKNKGVVAGGRVAFKPLKATSASLISKLTVGATFVRDINQFAGLKDSDNDGYPDFQDGFPDNPDLWLDTDGDGITDEEDPDADGDNLTDPWYTQQHGLNTVDLDGVEHADLINIENDIDGVSVAGVDLGFPLIERIVHLDLYGQYSTIHTGNENIKGGWGIGAPGLRLLTERLKAQVEYRHFEGRFRPNYFDHLYEHERVMLVGNNVITKEMTLLDESLNGIYGMLGYNFFDLVNAGATYQHMTGNKTFNDLTGKVAILDRVLQQVPKISLAEAYYYNTYVDPDRYNLLDLTENTLYGTRIGFELTPGMIIVWDTRYTFSPNAKGGLDKHRFVSIETVMTVR